MDYDAVIILIDFCSFSSATSHVEMELSEETSFVSRGQGMISLLYQPMNVYIWKSLLQSKSVRWESVSHSGSQQSGAR